MASSEKTVDSDQLCLPAGHKDFKLSVNVAVPVMKIHNDLKDGALAANPAPSGGCDSEDNLALAERGGYSNGTSVKRTP